MWVHVVTVILLQLCGTMIHAWSWSALRETQVPIYILPISLKLCWTLSKILSSSTELNSCGTDFIRPTRRLYVRLPSFRHHDSQQPNPRTSKSLRNLAGTSSTPSSSQIGLYYSIGTFRDIILLNGTTRANTVLMGTIESHRCFWMLSRVSGRHQLSLFCSGQLIENHRDHPMGIFPTRDLPDIHPSGHILAWIFPCPC